MDATEKRITRALVAHLAGAGFVPVRVMDDEATDEESATPDADAIIRYTEEVDLFTYCVAFRGADDRLRWLLLIPGNGEDILSDWGIRRGTDDDPWDKALEAFVDGEAA